MSFATDTCLPFSFLAMDTSTNSTIPDFSCHVTIFYTTVLIQWGTFTRLVRK
jgi:hypothetical protein